MNAFECKEVLTDNECGDGERDLLLPANYVNVTESTHINVLNETKDVALSFVISSSIGFIIDTMIITAYILFAETMDNTSSIISLMVLFRSIGQIIGILIISYFSDKFGFDTLSLFTATILLIAIILQSASYNIIQFIFAVFLHSLVTDDIEILSLGFFGKLLPVNDAAVYTAYYYSSATVSFVFGIIFSGLLITFTDYRYIFIISVFIMFIRLIYIVYKIRNKQNILIEKQLQLIPYYTSLMDDNNFDENNVFPLCLQEIKHKTGVSLKNKEFDIIHWIELILNIISFSLISCQYMIEFQFLMLYMIQRFDLKPILGMSQMTIDCITFILTTYMIPEYFANISLLKKYIMSFPFYIVCSIIYMIANPFTNRLTIYLYWIWPIFIGIGYGVLTIITEICILELQPTHDTGKINGLKTIIRYGYLAASSALIVYYWNINNHIWFWYFQAFTFIVGFICITIIIIMRIIIYYCNSNTTKTVTQSTNKDKNNQQYSDINAYDEKSYA